MGHSVIRWRQYHSVSSQHQDQPSQLLWFHAFSFPFVCYRRVSTALSKCLRRAGTSFPLPQCLCHLHLCSSMHIATAFRCLQSDIYCILQHTVYAVLKCQLLPYFCFVLTLLRIYTFILHVGAWGSFWRRKASVYWTFLCFVILFRSLHKKNLYAYQQKMSSKHDFLWNAKIKKAFKCINPWNRLIHHKVFWSHF